MVFDLFKGGGDSQLDLIETQVQEMLEHCLEAFDLAYGAVVRRHEPGEVGKTLRKSDRRVNKGERAIRRELIVHAGVRLSGADIPVLLTYMSIIKDIERVGDYAKNVWDLADDGFDLSEAEDRPVWDARADALRSLIADTARIFHERDSEAAAGAMPELDERLDVYDEEVSGWVVSDRPSNVGVPRALLARHFKRMTAHLMNVLTAVVMPVDRLDYWDEDKADRTS